MIKTLLYIYNKLFIPSSTDPEIELSEKKLLNNLQSQCSNQDEIFKDFSSYLNNLDYICAFDIERFCLARLSDFVISKYPVNIAEAYVLSYLFLNSKESVNNLYFKLGISGLLTPTMINNQKVEDAEVIAQFIIKSLQQEELISLSEKEVSLGKNFIIID